MLTFSNFRLLWQWDWEGKVSHSSGLHNGRSVLSSGGSSSGGSSDSSGEESGEGSDHGGMVDDVVSDVLGGVLLDSDMGDLVDLVVDIVADMLDHGGGVDHRDGGGGNSVLNWDGGGLHLNRLHLHGLQGGVGDSRGGSVGDDGGGHMLDHGHGLGDGINES